MKYTILHLGSLKVAPLEMIMGLPDHEVLEAYPSGGNEMRIGMQGLIVETGNRIIFFDPGCATFLNKSLAETYDLQMDQTLTETVRAAGYRMDDITDVIYTHLHFDHGSGAFIRIPGGIVKAFPKARYIVSRKQLEYLETGPEDLGSYFHKLLRFAGELTYIEDWEEPGIRFEISHGHTPWMLVPVMDLGDRDLVFATDVIPMKLHLRHGAWSYYDHDKVLLHKERERLLNSLRPGYELVFFHEMN